MNQLATNNGSTLNFNGDDLKVAVNSIQRTLFVERLYVNKYFPADRIIPYDVDNLYPNKIKSIAQRSGTTISAIETLSSFMRGEGFAGMDQVVNRDGQTLFDILRHVCDSKSMFPGFALHFNYNLLGQITEINTINFEFVRWSKDLTELVVNPDWGRRTRRKDEVNYKPFNPANVLQEIQECSGIGNYKGQILYFIPCKSDLYMVTHWDAVLDDAQFEAEAKLYGLSSIQNDYSLGGVLAYPENIANQQDVENIRSEVKKDTGSDKAGGIRVIGAKPLETMNNWKWFTPISRNNIDGLHKNQIETAKFNIYAKFRQPPILNGVATSGMFNDASFADAFNYYNAVTQTERNDVQKELSKILAVSIWSNIIPQITPKKYTTRDSLAPAPTNVNQ